MSRKWESRKSESEGRREIVKSYELMVESFGFQVSGCGMLVECQKL